MAAASRLSRLNRSTKSDEEAGILVMILRATSPLVPLC